MTNMLNRIIELNQELLNNLIKLQDIAKDKNNKNDEDLWNSSILKTKRNTQYLEDVINKYGIRNQHILSTPPLDGCSRLVNNSSCSVTPPSGITNKDVLKNFGGNLSEI